MQAKNPRRSGARYSGGIKPTRGIPLLLLLFGAILLAMILLAPSQPVSTAVTEADENSQVVAPGLHITEVMSSNKKTLPDEKGAFPDWIELTNEGNTPLNLDGFGLSDREDKIIFTFPHEDRLEPGARVIVFASNESQSYAGSAYHANFKISSAGETLVLFGPEGDAIEHITVPAMAGDMVYAKTSDSWIISDQPTPGYENTKEGYAAFLSSSLLEANALMLNEIVASNRTTLMDEDGEFSDWLELYNATGRVIDLSSYALSDNPERPVKWRFPEGATIAPGEYYVVFCSGKDRSGGDGKRPHANFGLSAERETVILSDIHGLLIDQTTYEVMPADASWGRKETGDHTWQFFSQPTPGMANNQASALEMNRRMLQANISGVAITEVMSSNVATLLPSAEGVDWVELYNYSNAAINLGNYGLSDRIEHPRKWRFPDVTLLPGQYLLVYCDGLGKVGSSGDLHTNFKLSSAGETLAFCDPSGRILDKLAVPQLLPDLSYGRTPGQDGLFYYAQPTPGDPNSEAFFGFSEEPRFITPGGMYRHSPQVEIEVPEGTEVRYTLDCTSPTQASQLYTGPFEVPATTVVRARSFQGGLQPSNVITQTFFVSAFHSLPILSMVTEPDNITNPDTGMLADGPELDRETQEPPWKKATYWKKLHYDGNLEMYLQDASEIGTQVLSTGMSFHVMGQYSLDMPQKSFSLNAKKRFGTGYFEYNPFGDRPFAHYKSFALRNGGQDGQYTRVIDGLQGRIIASTPNCTVITQAWQPVVAYLNGEYWGHYNLRERISRYFVAQHEGWDDPDAMDILESNGTSSSQINWGSNSEYKKLLKYVEEHDLNDPEALQYVVDRVDVDNFFDFHIFTMYFGNSDTGNIRYYKKHGDDNKWRWIFYDSDWGLFYFSKNAPDFFLNPKGSGSQHINNLILRKLLANPDMLDRFLTRFGELFQTVFTPEYILPMMDEMITQIQPELQMHFTRWADEMSPKISFDVPKNPEGAYAYWGTRVAWAKKIINSRPNALWGMMKEYFKLSDSQMLQYFGPEPAPYEEEKK